MDLDALRTGIEWDFESFGDYMAMLRRRSPYANVAVLAGHSTIRTAVMGEAASQRKDATPEELAKMKAMVVDAMANGAIGLGASYSLNHSGYGGVPMPSTIAPMDGARRAGRRDGPARQGRDRHRLGREDAAGAGADGRQVRPAVLPGHRHGDVQRAGARRARSGSSTIAPPRIRRGNGLYIQIPCQPLSFDFTMANAYPFYSHPAFDPIKAYTPEQLKTVFRDASWRAQFRENAQEPAARHDLPGQLASRDGGGGAQAGQREVRQPLHRRDRRERAPRSARRHARPRARRGSGDGVPRPLPQCRRRRRGASC